MDQQTCSDISFYLVKLDPGTHFSFERQSASSHLVFYHCSRRISNSKKSSDEIEFHRSRDCNQAKTVCYTGSTQPKMQPSREVSNFVDDCVAEEEMEKDLSTHFLQMQKNQLIDLQEHFERYWNVSPVFGFNSAKYDINLIKSHLLPILVNEQDIEPTFIKKANQFVSYKFGDIQLLDIINFLGGATSLDSFLTAYKNKDTKGFFPYDKGSVVHIKWTTKSLLPMTPCSAFCAIATPLKKITTTFKTCQQWFNNREGSDQVTNE